MTKTILVTRPLSQGEALCRQLQQRGFATRHVPVMTVSPLQDAESITRIHTCFSRLNDYHGLIVVSLNAAEQALFWLACFPVHQPLHWFSVGKTTAQFLQNSLALKNGASIIYPHERMDSEGLLALPALQADQVKGQHFLLLRGKGGRELIANTLTERGAHVSSCELYHRLFPEQNARLLQEAIQAADSIIINSGESLENFLRLAGSSSAFGKTLVVPGERVAQIARQAGFQHIIVAANATDEATLDAIHAAFAT